VLIPTPVEPLARASPGINVPIMEAHLPAPTKPRHRRSPRPGSVIATCAALVLLSACTSLKESVEEYVPIITQFGVYKIDINQGNFISQDMVDKLKNGQSKQQVRSVLGTPLIMSAFRDNRWDYVYEFRRAGRLREHRQFTVYFQDEQLARWEGDEMPQSTQDLNRAAANRAMPVDPYGQDGGVIGKIIDFFRRIGDPTAPPTP
jgi:outer membrane protein assembly factor BamE (lipoprotein component of BamABCDE complex)